MNIFEITIQRRNGATWPVIAEQSAADRLTPQRDEGALQLDEAALLALDLDPMAYGRALGEALFHGPVGDAFRRALSRAEDRLRVLLFVEAPELLGLRWERLCAPIDDGWQLLAISQRAPFSRYLPSLTDRRFPPIGRQDLRALIVTASPQPGNRYQLPAFDAVATHSGVQAALGTIPSAVLADSPGAAASPTLDAICAQITAEPYTVLHIVCHGLALSDGDSALFLSAPDGQASVEPVTATRLLERLGNLQGARGLPRVIFLAACESASPQADAAFGGLAQRLVRELGVPAVVAMTDKVQVTTANALAAAFYSRLVEHGEVDRALVEATAGLAERGDVMVPVLFSRLGGRPLFSEAPDRALSGVEIGAGLARLQPLVAARAPVLVGELDRAASELRRSLELDPASLAPEARRERAAALELVDALCLEAVELRFADLAGNKPPPAYDDRCPFPGLRAFASDLRAFFFGREALVARLAERLAEEPTLAVLGASGSGKSSAVFAGLVPALQAARPGLRVLTMTPGAQPTASLRALFDAPAEPQQTAATLLIVDQFEEAFTLCADPAERRAFFDALLDLPPGQLLVLTMRADFWGEVAPYPRLRELLQAHQELVAPMSPDELRRAIELQAAAVGLRFEADLAGQILDDVRGEPGAMPLLQHALQELWQRRRGRWLRGGEYRAIGGIQQAIAHTADAIYGAATPPERERLRDIFLRLTRIDRAEAGGGERRDTRQRVAFAELVPAGADPAPIRELVRRLADARLIVTGVAASGHETVEVAHEALIRSWPRLHGWLEEDRQSLLLRDAIRQAALEWSQEERDEDLLFRGSRLDEALALGRQPRFAPNELERAFLDAALAMREREEAARDEQRRRELEQAQALAAEQQRRADESAAAARQLRSRAVFLAGVAVVALVAMVAAGIFGVQSRRAEVRAEASAAEARARALTADARSAQAFAQPDLSLALAVEAARSTPPLPESFNVLAAVADNAARWRAPMRGKVQSIFFMHGGQTIGVGRKISIPYGLTFLSPEGEPSAFSLPPYLDRRTGSVVVDFLTIAAVSPDGETLFSFSQQYAEGAISGAILWTIAGGEPVSDPEQILFYNPPVAAAFHPDGEKLVLAQLSGTIVVVDVPTKRVLGLLEAPAPVSEAGAQGLPAAEPASSADPVIALPAEGAVAEAPPQIVGVAISPDGATIAILKSDGSVQLLSFESGAELQVLEEPTRIMDSTTFSGLAYSPDGTRLASAGPGGVVRLWQLGSDALPGVLSHGSAVSALAFSPDGAMLAVGRSDGLIQLWSTTTSAELRSYAGHRDAVQSLAFHPAGHSFVSGSADEDVRLWDAGSGFLVAGLAGESPTPIGQVAFSAAEAPLLRDWSNRLRRWDPAGGAALSPLGDGPAPQVIGMGAGRALSYDAEQNELHVWDLERGAQLAAFEGDTAPPELRTGVQLATISPDGESFVTPTSDKMLLRSMADGSVVRELDLTPTETYTPQYGIGGVVFSQDGSMAAATSSVMSAVGGLDPTFTTELLVWEVASGRRVVGQRISETAGATSVTLSPDGSLVATGMSDASVLLWRTSDGALDRTLRGHIGPVMSAAFSPDGAMLATGGGDSTIRLWDMASGTELRVFTITQPFAPTALSFNQAGDRLLAGDTAGGVTLWRIEGGQALVDWVVANRYIAELGCAERERYQLERCPQAPAETPTPQGVVGP